ncbi:MAG TPA: DUF4388 domain-containing protein, partial [Polyangiaceae bacterium]|nr:DUF4388 domain-containing protein [Polyangiaceae bacterium]
MGSPPSPLSDAEKSALIQQILDGRTNAREACAQHGISGPELEGWVRQFRRGVQRALDRELESALSRRGLDVGELSRSEFSGDVGQLGVGEVLQTIEAGRKDWHISVTHEGERSEIWCRDGEVVDARSGSLEGEAAFYRILTLTEGQIVAALGPHERPRRIDLSTPRLLLKAASSSGLRARLMQRLGDPRQVFVVDPHASRRRITLSGDERDVLGLCDGARSVEEVVFASGLADARALDIIARFRDQQVLAPSRPPAAAATASLPASGNLTMSYGPMARSQRAAPARLPHGVLAAGAVVCSALGALSVVVLSPRPASVGPERLGANVPSAQTGSTRLPAPAAAPTGSGSHAPPRSAPARPNAPAQGGTVHAALPPAPQAAPAPCPASMVWLAGGRFTMGTDSNAASLSLARPAHRVTLRG